MSMGSPASPSSSTTEPWPSCSRFLMVSRVRPSSTVSWTGTSMIRSMSLPVLPAVLARGLNTEPPAGLAAAAAASAGGAPAAACSAMALAQSSCGFKPSAWVAGAPAADCSASASAQSSAGRAGEPGSAWPGRSFVSVMVGSLVRVAFVSKQVLDAQRVLAVEDAVAAFHQRHAIDAGDHFLGHVDRQYIARLQAHQLADGRGDGGEFGRQLDVGAAHLARQLLCPALVHFLERGFLQRPGQQVAHRLDHGI